MAMQGFTVVKSWTQGGTRSLPLCQIAMSLKFTKIRHGTVRIVGVTRREDGKGETDLTLSISEQQFESAFGGPMRFNEFAEVSYREETGQLICTEDFKQFRYANRNRNSQCLHTYVHKSSEAEGSTNPVIFVGCSNSGEPQAVIGIPAMCAGKLTGRHSDELVYEPMPDLRQIIQKRPDWWLV